MEAEGKTYHSSTSMSTVQKILNVLFLLIIVLLSASVTYMYVQLNELRMSGTQNTEVIHGHSTEQRASIFRDEHDSSISREETTQITAAHRDKRQANGATTAAANQVNADSNDLAAMSSAAIHHHWKARYLVLQAQVNRLAKPWQPHSAQLKMCGEGTACYRNVSTNGADYGRWMDADVQGRNNKTIPTLHTNNNLSTPVIPEKGLYHVYGQITWRGKANSTTASLADITGKSVGFSIVTLPEENSQDYEVNLLTTQCTQYKLGGMLGIAPRANQFPDDFPLDSSIISGNVYLRAGQILAMKIHRFGNILQYAPDKSFFGYYQLQKY